MITIDPSSHSSGVAIWQEQTLIGAYVAKAEGDPINMARAIFALCSAEFWFSKHAVVIETQQEFAGQRPRIADLIKLATTTGVIAGYLSYAGHGIGFVLPSEWKGQIPKPGRVSQPYIVAERCKRLLRPEELEAVQIPSSKRACWDVWDAIGIGLVALGRARRGVAAV